MVQIYCISGNFTTDESVFNLKCAILWLKLISVLAFSAIKE